MSLVDLGKRLLEAAKKGDTDEVRTLMASGAPFTTDWLGTSPLHFGSQQGHVGTAEVLLRAGISRDARTKVDRTPLHAASQQGHSDIVELLLKHSADVDAKDMLKMTPLHWACEKGHDQVVNLLVIHGADVNSVDKFDRTPLDIALATDRADIYHILQSAGEQLARGNEIQHVEVQLSEVDGIPVTSSATIFQTPASTTNNDDLATLAALAEVTGPIRESSTNVSASDTLNWLETHGITMISTSEASSIVASQLGTGQSFTLTEAGKLALTFVKGQQQTDSKEQSANGPQKVITLVTEDGENVKAVLQDRDANHTSDTDESPAKKTKLSVQSEEVKTEMSEWLEDKNNTSTSLHETQDPENRNVQSVTEISSESV